MADFSTLIASIEATIKQNGVQAITGQVLQDELLLMVSAINQLKQDTLEGYAFYGEALPNGATRVVTQNTFFLAGAGSYTINGNSVTIADSGISVVVYDCVNDEITTYQLFAYDANPTSGSANAVTSGGVKSALDTKADKNGASPDLFAGFAGNLVDTRSAGTRQGPFAFRQSGGDGVNYMRKILGRTEAWNQLVPVNKITVSSGTYDGLTIVNNGDGTISVSGTSEASGYVNIATALGLSIGTGKKILLKQPSNASVNFYLRTITAGAYLWNDVKDICTLQSPEVLTISLVYNSGVSVDVRIPIMLFNITLLYGSGNEPATVAAFQSLHPLPYYNYNAGVLKNNAATSLQTVGFNQWDEKREGGSLDNTGQPSSLNADTFRSKNFIPVLAANTYYFGCETLLGGYLYIHQYDASKNYIGALGAINLGTTNRTFVIAAGVAFIKFYIYKASSNWRDNVPTFSICINISDASRNGEYEPYWKRDIVLGLDNLVCHDENNNAVVVNGLDGVGTSQDELIVENGWGTKIIKRRGRRAYHAGDESDATLMTDGTNTDYPLPTPKVLTLDNPIPALIEVDNLGTEKRLPEDTADNPQAPFECDSNYSISTANLVRKLNE